MKVFLALVAIAALLVCATLAAPSETKDERAAPVGSESDEPVAGAESVRDKRGLKFHYHVKEKSVGGIFPFKHSFERKVHIKHGPHGAFHHEVTKVKHFGK